MDLSSNILQDNLPALFQSVTEGIIISDADGVILLANPSAHQMFGYEKNSMIGLTIEDLMPKHFNNKHKEYRHNYNKNPQPRAMGKNLSLIANRKSGEEFPVEISLSHYTKDSKNYVISIVVDITERKQHEETVHQLNRELEQKVCERTFALQKSLTELENSKKQLEETLNNEKELNDLKSRFVTTASHEFRTPLSTILLSMSLIEKYQELNDTKQHEKHVKRIKGAVTGLMLILEDLLSTEELQKGVVKITKNEFSLKDLTNNLIIKMHRILRPGQKIEFNYEGKEIVSLDKQIIKSILTNTISNASKFSDENKTIVINIKASDDAVTLQIIDEGIGIPTKEQKYLCQKFFRASNAINVQGTGLGLNIVKKYIELMKGTIEFESSPEKGTTFTLIIPNDVV